MLNLHRTRKGPSDGCRCLLSWAGAGLLILIWAQLATRAANDSVPATATVPVVSEEDRSPIVAQGQGLSIRAAELEARVRRTLQEITNSGRTLSAAQSKELPGRLLNQLIFTRLTAARATPGDRARAQFESRSFVDGLQRDLGSPAALLAKLQAMGLTEAAFRAEKLEEALATAVTEREVRASIRIPDADVRKYYDEEPARWQRPEQIRAAHLLLATQTKKGEPLLAAAIAEKMERLRKIRKQVQGGGDFAALVKQFSEDKVSQATGGEYTFSRGQLDPTFEATAFGLKPGELSEIVTTPYGFHLLLCRAHIPATNTPLEAVAADIRGVLIQREHELRVPEYADRIRREAKVEVFVP